VNPVLTRFVAKLRNLFARKQRDADLDHEIAAHLGLLEEELLRRGETPSEALRKARIACGTVEATRQSHRDARSFLWLAQAAQDIRHAFRSMRRFPGFTVAAIFTLAVGIGANTAVFSVIDAVLLAPLPYPQPDRIVQFFLASPGGEERGASIPDFRFWLDHANSVQDISAYDFDQSEMGLTSAVPEQVHGLHVTSGYFRLFGAPLMLGQSFTSSDDNPAGARVVVLSYNLWKRRFAGDQHIIGEAVSIDKENYTVVGVTGPDFLSEPDAQLWIPFRFDLNSTDQFHSFGVAGRLKPGITLAEANAQLASIASSTQHSRPDPDFRFELHRLHDAIAGDIRPTLFMLQGAVTLVLLIACANLANLLLARMTTRQREFAIRAAIGAGRGRILRQLTTESLVLCACGCVLGIVLSLIGARVLLALSPGSISRIGPSGAGVTVDLRVMSFALAISLATGLIFGLLPTLAISRTKIPNALRESGSRQSAGVWSRRSRSLIVITEIALSLILLIGASLLIRTLIALSRVDPGFSSHNVALVTMPLEGRQFATGANVAAMVSDARRQLAAIPGVENAAATFSAPYASRMGMPFASVSNGSTISGDAEWMAVSPGYLGTLQIPVLRGRNFDEHDDSGAPGVALVNEGMVRQYWPGDDPLGQQIEIGKGLGPNFVDRSRRIIGIVADTRDDDLSQAAAPTMIIPDAQEPDGMVQLETKFGPLWWIVHTRVAPRPLIPAIEAALRRASGGRAVGGVRTMEEVLSRSIARQRFNMVLLAAFAVIALLLAAAGIYGVMAYSVAQRTQEIGVRMALGADRAQLRRMILREGLIKGTVGLVCGISAAFFLVHLLAGLLFGVTTRDPLIFIAAPIFLLAVTLAASWIPARRASSLNPVEALHFE